MASMPTLARTLRRMERRHMAAEVTIETVTQGYWDPDTGVYTETVEATHYQGRATVVPEPDRLYEVTAGDARVGIRLYRVTVEHDADVPRDARVTVDSSPDAAMVGRELTVFDYELSDRVVTRVLICREMR